MKTTNKELQIVCLFVLVVLSKLFFFSFWFMSTVRIEHGVDTTTTMNGTRRYHFATVHNVLSFFV